MNGDWQWKLAEAVKRIQERYAYVGSKTGASLLAIVYPPEAENAVYREWDAQIARLGSDYDIQTVDVLAITVQAVADLGSEHVVASIADPMPGSNPEAELGRMWITAVTREIHDRLDNSQAESAGCCSAQRGRPLPGHQPARPSCRRFGTTPSPFVARLSYLSPAS